MPAMLFDEPLTAAERQQRRREKMLEWKEVLERIRDGDIRTIVEARRIASDLLPVKPAA